jgi:hypothetical protein
MGGQLRLVAESLADVLRRPSHGTRVVRIGVADDRKRTHSLHESDLERETVGSCAYGIDEAMKRDGAFVVGFRGSCRHSACARFSNWTKRSRRSR